MIDLTPILPHVGPFLIVLSRITGLFIFAPVLGSQVVPGRIKALFALAMTTATYATLSGTLAEHGAVPLPLTLFGLAPLMAMELAIGLAIGFLASLPMLATELGGLIVGQQLGLGFARVYNPAMETDAEVVGQMLFYLAMVIFLALGGLETMFVILLDTFEHVPPGAFRVTGDLLALAGGLLTSAFELAIRIAAPVLCLIFLESFALGFMNKTAPAFNILSLGFPIRIILGTVALIASLGPVHEGVTGLVGDVLDLLREFFSAP